MKRAIVAVVIALAAMITIPVSIAVSQDQSARQDLLHKIGLSSEQSTTVSTTDSQPLKIQQTFANDSFVMQPQAIRTVVFHANSANFAYLVGPITIKPILNDTNALAIPGMGSNTKQPFVAADMQIKKGDGEACTVGQLCGYQRIQPPSGSARIQLITAADNELTITNISDVPISIGYNLSIEYDK